MRTSAATVQATKFRVIDFLALTKPRLNALVVVTTSVGYCLGVKDQFEAVTFLHTLIGSALVAGAAAALNQVSERDIDETMERTRHRPIPSGRVQPWEACIFAAFLTGLGLTELAIGANILASAVALVTLVSYIVGIMIGACLGYVGGKVDLLGQRTIEIWASLPFLYTIIFVSSIVVPVYIQGRMQILQPSFLLLIAILAAFEWMAMTYYVRGEFYREKAKDYVGAAIVTGVSDTRIMFSHILPNALTPVISFAPFAIVANISALVALDFLGFGLPAPTPSWGELIGQGMTNLTKSWLVFFPLGALFTTLLLVVFIGEAMREAFDPKEHSRLR